MANTIITPKWVTTDVAAFWDDNVKLVGRFDRQWDDSYRNKPGGAKIGATLSVRLPQRFTVSEGQALEQQAILNQVATITVNHQQHVDMGWSSAEATLEIEDVQKRYTMPAGKALAAKCDVTAANEIYPSIYYSIGTPGTAITDDQTILDGIARLEDVSVPGPLVAVMDPKASAKLVGANVSLFGPKYQEMFNTGQFAANALGIDEWYTDNHMPIHTTGTFTTSTPVVSSALQTGSTLALSGLGTYAFKKGDVFRVDGVNAVEPISFADSGDLQDFVLTADAAGSSTVTLNISPAIITSGQLQTVTASPGLSAAVTFLGATGTVSATMAATKSKQSFIFNEGAFAFVFADLKENLAGARTAMARSKEARISMRWAEQFNIQTDQNPSRCDILYGTAAILPYFAMRMFGA